MPIFPRTRAARLILALSAFVAITGLIAPNAAYAAQPATFAHRTWLSGASGTGTANGAFGAWRGTGVQIVGTWSDDNANMVQFWPMRSGGPLASWNKPLDVAIGAIGPRESWGNAAKGAYDARWIASLKKLSSLRSDKSGTTYIRFAHEMNGNWYPWSVNRGNYRAFDRSWKRFRALQKKYYPAAKLVFSVNRESIGTGMDWRKFFPGAAFVDVLSVDYYNQYPYVGTARAWQKTINQVDAYGAAEGIAQHLAFAKRVGLPLAVSEWAGVESAGNSAQFIKQMHAFFVAHAGTGAGKVLYEIYFNVGGYNANYSIFGNAVKLRKAAAEYRKDF